MTLLDRDRFTPQQSHAFDSVLRCLEFHPLVGLRGDEGSGRTTLLRSLHARLGGKLLTMRDYIEATSGKHPLGTDEWFYDLLVRSFDEEDVVLIDDLHLAAAVPAHYYHPRHNYFAAAMEAAAALAESSGKRLIVTTANCIPNALQKRLFTFGIEDFEPEDFAAIGRNSLGAAAERIDWRRIHRFGPHLCARQLSLCCRWLTVATATGETAIDTEQMLAYLAGRHLVSNVDLDEVDDVELPDLIGVDDVIASLEENIVFPLSDDPLARSLDLQPKRGVLLAGPPGTGKTSVGRALAHKLGGKFFLIDGTAISGTDSFYGQVNEVFEQAVHNSPSVVFIDDSDVIFESGREHGLYRYLLTKLDGLESESASRVCVMLTAMDVGNIPPALVRSGRIELWLEMRLPDEAARETILRRAGAGRPCFENVDFTQAAARTEEFSGADLKRLVQDAMLAYAADLKAGRPDVPMEARLCEAADAVRRNRRIYAEAESRANARRPSRPQWFSPAADFHRAEE